MRERKIGSMNFDRSAVCASVRSSALRNVTLVAAWFGCACLAVALPAQSVNSASSLEPLDQEGFRKEIERLDAICAKLNLADERKLMSRWIVSDKADARLLFLPTEPMNSAHATWLKHFTAARSRHAQYWYEMAQQQSKAGDEWAAYLSLWRAAREDSSHAETKRVLGGLLPALNVKGKPRPVNIVHPTFSWPAGSYSRMETANFKITSRAEPAKTQQIAAQLETFYALWTQSFYPIWAAPGVTTQRLSERNTSWQRKQQVDVVLCKDREDYLKTLGVAEANIGVSVGYYSPDAQMSFFYPDESLDATLYHELTHQLLAEASQLKGTGQPGEKGQFWLIEAVALYMESLQREGTHWRLGGWLAPRMQGARYRAVHDGYWIDSKELDGIGFAGWKEREDIARLYTHASGLAHFFMDRRIPKSADETNSTDELGDSENGGSVQEAEKRLASFDAEASRAAFFSSLIAAYRGERPPEKFWQIAGDEHAHQDYLHFQLVRDRHIQLLDVDEQLGSRVQEIVLPRSRLSSKSWQAIGRLKQLTWLDISNSNARADDVRWISSLTKLQRLSLEGIQVDQQLLTDVSRLPTLKELDLSHCNVDDDLLQVLKGCTGLETVWLTGNRRVTAASVTWIEKLPKMKFVGKP